MITGKQFNEQNKNIQLVTVTDSEDMQCGVKYAEWVNEKPQGLFFCRYDDFPFMVYNLNNPMVHMWDVEIPDDANVDATNKKIKCTKFVLSNKRNIWDEDNNCLRAVKFDGLLLHFIEKQNNEICIEAIKENSKALGFVNDQNDKVYTVLLESDGLNIQHVIKQTLELCETAVKQNIEALKYMDQTDEVCFMAIKHHVDALKYVKKQTQELCLEAVKLNRACFKHVSIEFRPECKAFMKSQYNK